MLLNLADMVGFKYECNDRPPIESESQFQLNLDCESAFGTLFSFDVFLCALPLFLGLHCAMLVEAGT
jgi:hypothetical protein